MSAEDPGNPVDWEAAWEIGWPREAFIALKVDPRFLALLTIARLRNMLRFTQGLIVLPPKDLPPPAARRHTMNAFYLMNALLVEAERVIDGTGARFREFSHYRLIAS
ncbi:MAG: hypothetical protein A2W26_02970 [Acidobacteria bacterium RBG_16_64_8]|nr:MAG: hypothetical protein A2W26_02970 [Acidobacteria bacterium RBG_16_64_8]